jgi:hypothetical protein
MIHVGLLLAKKMVNLAITTSKNDFMAKLK